MSGPSPVGTCAANSARMSSKFLITSSTAVPVSAVNLSAAAETAASRFSSTQTTILPPAAAALVSPVAAEVVSSVVPPPPHAASESASPAVVASRMLRRIYVLLQWMLNAGRIGVAVAGLGRHYDATSQGARLCSKFQVTI